MLYSRHVKSETYKSTMYNNLDKYLTNYITSKKLKKNFTNLGWHYWTIWNGYNSLINQFIGILEIFMQLFWAPTAIHKEMQ